MAITLDGTTGISSVDGSAASPSVRGTDANSGIVYSSDAIKFSTGGTQRAIIDNNGLNSAGHILNVSSMTLSSDGGTTCSNTTVDTGVETSIVRKSASSHFIIYIASNVYRPSNNGMGFLGYKRAINSGSYSADQQMRYAADANLSITSSILYIDTTTGSVGDTVKITARYQNNVAQDDHTRVTQTLILEFEP